MKKAQMMSQIFTYLVAIFIVGLILIFGYNAIKDIGNRSEQISLVQFKSSLESNFKSVASNYGEIKIITLDIPSKYNQLCILSRLMLKENNYEQPFKKYPLFQQAYEEGKDNAFLFNDKTLDFEPFYVGPNKLDSSQPILCFESVRSKIKLKLEGKGNYVFVMK